MTISRRLEYLNIRNKVGNEYTCEYEYEYKYKYKYKYGF